MITAHWLASSSIDAAKTRAMMRPLFDNSEMNSPPNNWRIVSVDLNRNCENKLEGVFARK